MPKCRVCGTRLTKFDKDIIIYPGHGDSCSLGEANPEAYL